MLPESQRIMQQMYAQGMLPPGGNLSAPGNQPHNPGIAQGGMVGGGPLRVPPGQEVIATFVDSYSQRDLIVHCTQSVFRINLETNEVVQLL